MITIYDKLNMQLNKNFIPSAYTASVEVPCLQKLKLVIIVQSIMLQHHRMHFSKCAYLKTSTDSTTK